ncbi:MAG TPA: site-specific DNA-methyltransferase [Puia sp.]|nr:site-specific DNA-methyltransferase [Puia sp.]
MPHIEKMPLTSMDLKEAQIEKLKELFPEAFTEGNKIDWEKLKLTLGENVEVGKERFGMNWPGKADCFKTIQQPSIATLVPVREESIDFDQTQNLFIEGDNLEVLKLLQKSYLGKIKIIYIDPPYNTGKDFIYPDNYAENLSTYLEYTGQVDSEGRKFSINTETDGRFHSKWMNMMYPRLFLAKNLLREDGVIFISIDNNEVQNLKAICNEVFGEENFIECITWNKRVPKNDKGIGNIHEYILLYVKDKNYKHEFKMPKEGMEEIEEVLIKIKNKKIPIKEAEAEISKLFNKKGYDRGITLYNSLDENYRLWGKINMSWPNAETYGPRYTVYHPETGKEVKIPDRGWRWKQETFDDAAKIVNGKYTDIKQLHDGSFVCGRIWFDSNENTQPSSINYLDELDSLLLRSILSLKSDGGIEVENIFEGKNYFSYPKPTTLLRLLLGSVKQTEKNEIILDFFAGSSTTAEAVLQLNAQDLGNHSFISVQLPEPTEPDSEAYKSGYKTLAEVSKERVRRAIKKIINEKGQVSTSSKGTLFDNTDNTKERKLDLGFKTFNLQKSNFKAWDTSISKSETAVQSALDLHVSHVSVEAKEEAILYEILLKSGFTLSTDIKKLTIENSSVFSIEGGELLICLERSLNRELIKAIAEKEPTRVICLDEGFQNNDQLKTNAVQIMKSKNVLNFRTV